MQTMPPAPGVFNSCAQEIKQACYYLFGVGIGFRVFRGAVPGRRARCVWGRARSCRCAPRFGPVAPRLTDQVQILGCRGASSAFSRCLGSALGAGRSRAMLPGPLCSPRPFLALIPSSSSPLRPVPLAEPREEPSGCRCVSCSSSERYSAPLTLADRPQGKGQKDNCLQQFCPQLVSPSAFRAAQPASYWLTNIIKFNSRRWEWEGGGEWRKWNFWGPPLPFHAPNPEWQWGAGGKLNCIRGPVAGGCPWARCLHPSPISWLQLSARGTISMLVVGAIPVPNWCLCSHPGAAVPVTAP